MMLSTFNIALRYHEERRTGQFCFGLHVASHTLPRNQRTDMRRGVKLQKLASGVLDNKGARERNEQKCGS